MNILKTNELGIKLKNVNFKDVFNNSVNGVLDKYNVNKDIYSYPQKEVCNMINPQVIRISKNVFNACQLINLKSVYNNADIIDFELNNLHILLPDDNHGIIRVARVGMDFQFIYFMHLKNPRKNLNHSSNTFSFSTCEYTFKNENKEMDENALKVIAYLYYGDITKKYMTPKSKIKTGNYTTFLNNSKENITFVDTTWRQRISTSGFKVSGHFRLQPYGQELAKIKLIWIDEFNKNGYNRKAGVELTT